MQKVDPRSTHVVAGIEFGGRLVVTFRKQVENASLVNEARMGMTTTILLLFRSLLVSHWILVNTALMD